MARLRVIHYLNQFFGGLGGEDAGDLPPRWFEGARGPGRALMNQAPDLEILGTLVAGDNHMAERLDEAVNQALDLLAASVDTASVDLFIAGPAFNAGRYGLACAALCRGVGERFGWPALTAVHPQNPAVAAYRRDVVMVRAGEDVMAMAEALAGIVRVAERVAAGEVLLPERDGTLARGLRQNYFADASGAERALELLLRKLRGEPIVSEYPMPSFDRVPPAPPVADTSGATIALVTSGGIVPLGNPDRIEAASASRWASYSVEELDALGPETHQSVHGGYDPTWANADPNRVLPLDMARVLEREGRIGRLFPRYYATVGNGTAVERARRFGEEIAAELVNEGVQAVIFTST
jgi:glycine reductase